MFTYSRHSNPTGKPPVCLHVMNNVNVARWVILLKLSKSITVEHK
jgi:hypothetical protein